MATSATIGPAIRTNVQRDKVKWRRRLIGVSDAFLALSMMLRWVQLKWKSGMAVCFATLSSLSHSLTHSFSLFLSFCPYLLFLFSFFLPFYIHPSSSPRILRPSSLHQIHSPHLHLQCTYTLIHTYTHMCKMHSVFSPCSVCFDSSPYLLLLPFLHSSRSSHKRARTLELPYVCLDLKIVWLVLVRESPNEPEIRSQLRTRER